jgi:parvulin-like peptidyl-prolyl isomerase
MLEQCGMREELNIKPIYGNKQPTNLLEKYDGIKKGLAFYYNSNQSLNSKNYELANNIVSRLKQGESFESLAKTYSQDLYSKSFGGLTGRNEENIFIPEVEEKISKISNSQPDIIPSSLGLHIILRDPENNTVRQIYLQNSSFEAWLKASAAEIKIKVFIKP